MIVSLLAAIGKNNELGANNSLLWKISDDVDLYKKISSEHFIIMGRKTFESVKGPLPGRENIVITSQYETIEGAKITGNLSEALEIVRKSGEEEAVVIGGGQIFQSAIELADKMYLSHVDGYFPKAEVFFPEINYEDWEVVESRSYKKNERNEYDFEFKIYVRKQLTTGQGNKK